MKKYWAAAAICALIGLVVFLGRRGVSPSESIIPNLGSNSAGGGAVTSSNNLSGGVPNSSSNSVPAAPPEDRSLASKAGQYIPPADLPSNLPPDVNLQCLRRVVLAYGETFGGNPVGTNPEITAALSGKNPKQMNFLTGQPGVRVNAAGELIDAWGTPYFFHQLSATVMEIHSAGPDRIMWTSDDLVAR